MTEMINFNLNCFLQCAEELLRADETIRALAVLNNLPAFYRDHEPIEVTSLRREVMSKIATASFYANSSNYELNIENQDYYLRMHQTLRGQLLLEDFALLSVHVPHVLDLGPGEYWMPRMLQHHKKEFTYKPIFVNAPSHDFYKHHFEKELRTPESSDPKIFFAGEVIEHLWNESDIRMEMERYAGLCDIIHISTPKYTFDTVCTDWRSKGDLGHLRAYTTKEFYNVITKLFPEYEITIYDSQILHARGRWKDSSLKGLK